MLTLAATVVFMMDAASKQIVRALPDASYRVLPGLYITRVEFNRRAFSQRRDRAQFMLWWIVALICAVILTRSGRALEPLAAQLGAGAALGGALGNLVDIIRRRSITDFVDLRWWPIFNLADVAIVCGLALSLWPLV